MYGVGWCGGAQAGAAGRSLSGPRADVRGWRGVRGCSGYPWGMGVCVWSSVVESWLCLDGGGNHRRRAGAVLSECKA